MTMSCRRSKITVATRYTHARTSVTPGPVWQLATASSERRTADGMATTSKEMPHTVAGTPTLLFGIRNFRLR